MKTELTPQQELFAQNVASGKNQSESYRIAYPKSLKWKDSTVWERASVQMCNNKVITRINEIRDIYAKKNEMTIEKVLKMMAEWMEFDPLQLVDENDCVKSMKDLAPEVRKSLASIEVVEMWSGSGENKHKTGELKKIKFIDKRATADMFMKKFGAYIENRNVKFDVADLQHIKDILDEIK